MARLLRIVKSPHFGTSSIVEEKKTKLMLYAFVVVIFIFTSAMRKK